MDLNIPDHPQLPAPVRAPTAASRPGYTEVPAYTSSPVVEDAGPVSLLEYWQTIRRRRGTILLAAFLGLVAAVLLTLPQTPIYQARASLEIQTLNQDFMNLRQVSPVSDQSTDYFTNDIQTHIKLLQSDTLLEHVVARVQASGQPSVTKSTNRISAWRRALNLPEPKSGNAQEQAAKFAADNLRLRAVGQTRVVEILCDSTEPKIAADFANTLANAYIDQSMEARWKMNQRTGEFLSRQLDDMRIKLERAEDQLNQYARQSGLLFTGTTDKNTQENISEAKLRQLQSELSRAQADRITKQSRYELARTSPPEALPDVLNDSSLREYQTKATDLRRQEAELSATYRPEYAKVKRVQAQIVTLEAALARERAVVLQRITNDYNEAQRREKLLAGDYASQAKLVSAESAKSIQYNILKREVDSTRQLYEAMLQRVRESSIASAMRASNVRIVDLAKVPKVPYKPRLPVNGALGLLAGIFLGIGGVILRERADRTLQGPGDAALYLNVPELGAIPTASRNGRRMLGYGSRSKSSRNAKSSNQPRATGAVPTGTVLSLGTPSTAEEASAAEAPGEDPQVLSVERVELITSQHGSSAAAEAFRVVLTSILFSGANGARPRTIVMTSSGAGEGKTTLTCNVAIAIAEMRRRVLLIDADMRKPRMHEIFNMSNDRGLSTILNEGAVGGELLEGLVRPTALGNVYLLSSGPNAGPSLLYSPVMAELLKRSKQEFDMVLIDTPPMLAMPDARVIGRQADAVILVIRAGKTARDAALAARERLAEDGTRILGTILNDWNPRQPAGSYYSGYGYYRGYAGVYYGRGEEKWR